MQENYSEEIKIETQDEDMMGPSQAAINFIKQFARAYTFTGIMQPGLEGIIVN